MKENKTFALVWDMDGTMVDTREAHWLAWKESLAAEKYDLDWETFLKTFGQRNDTILRSLLGADLPVLIFKVLIFKVLIFKVLIFKKPNFKDVRLKMPIFKV